MCIKNVCCKQSTRCNDIYFVWLLVIETMHTIFPKSQRFKIIILFLFLQQLITVCRRSSISQSLSFLSLFWRHTKTLHIQKWSRLWSSSYKYGMFQKFKWWVQNFIVFSRLMNYLLCEKISAVMLHCICISGIRLTVHQCSKNASITNDTFLELQKK